MSLTQHMFERLEDDNGISICYENLGDTYMKMGEKKQVRNVFLSLKASQAVVSERSYVLLRLMKNPQADLSKVTRPNQNTKDHL
jgi:hypothetical protein